MTVILLIAGERFALPGGEHLEWPERAERLGGSVRSGAGALGQTRPLVSMELHPADHGRGQVPCQARQFG